MNPHIQDQPSSEQDAKVREKIKRKDEEAPTQEDWEGGGSRPPNENVPATVTPPDPKKK